MKARILLLISIAILLVGWFSQINLPAVSAGIYSSHCMTLDVPGGRYYFTGQLSGASVNTGFGFNACLWIKADGIVLRLYELTMTGSGDQVGILNTANKVTIETIEAPGVILNYRVGIVLATGSGNIVNGVTLSSNTEAGIMIGLCCPATLGSDGNLIRGNTIISNGSHGVLVVNSQGTELRDNTITGTVGDGVSLIASTGSLINRNVITNGAYGIFADHTSGFTQVYWNSLDANSQFGILTLSDSNSIVDDNVSNSGLHGIAFAGDSNLIEHDSVYGSKGRGISLGGVCFGTTVYSAGNNNSVIADTALGNTVDFFWDGVGTTNIWLHDTASTPTAAIPLIGSGC